MELFKQTSDTRENLGLLAIMEAIEGGRQVTQRELAQITGLNLKKVNYCLRKLLEKGYVKFERVRKNPDKRAYLYILTPAGFRAKSQLTYGFLKFTLNFYSQVEHKLQRCLESMVASQAKRLVLYGVSDVARIILELADRKHTEIVAILDPDADTHFYHGIPIIQENQLFQYDWDAVLITSTENLDRVESHLHQLNVNDARIWKLS